MRSGRTTSTRSTTSRKASAYAATVSATRSSSTRKESFQLFQDMRRRIEEEVVRYLWWLRPVEGEARGQPAAPGAAATSSARVRSSCDTTIPVRHGRRRGSASGARGHSRRRARPLQRRAEARACWRRRRAGQDGAARGAQDRHETTPAGAAAARSSRNVMERSNPIVDQSTVLSSTATRFFELAAATGN